MGKVPYNWAPVFFILLVAPSLVGASAVYIALFTLQLIRQVHLPLSNYRECVMSTFFMIQTHLGHWKNWLKCFRIRYRFAEIFDYKVVSARSQNIFLSKSTVYNSNLFFHDCPDFPFNPNQSGIGGKPPTFDQNDFTPWCLKLNIFLKIWYGSQIVWPFFLNFLRTSK